MGPTTPTTASQLDTVVDTVVERDILGACLHSWGFSDNVPAWFVEEGVREAHFFSLHHQYIWRRMHQAVRDNLGHDTLTIRMLLTAHGEIDEVGAPYLFTLQDGMPRLRREGARTLARRLITCAVARELVASLQQVCVDVTASPSILQDGFFSRLSATLDPLRVQLRGRTIPEHVTHISQVMTEVREFLAAGAPEFVDTPWPTLNHRLGGGIARGEFVLLGARPGLGKTAMALEVARRTAKRGTSVFIVSREMLRLVIGLRMIAQEGPVEASALRRARLSVPQLATMDQAIESLETLPIFVTHAPLGVEEIQRVVGILADEGPLGLVIVDYLQLVSAGGNIRERRHQVEAVSSGLKAITLAHGVPVLCLSSLSRPSDQNGRPGLHSLRESGNLEHDADTVILLHRPEETGGRTECIVAKCRNGELGTTELHLRGEYLRFEERTATYGD